MNHLLSQLDAIIDSKHLLKHSFYTRWTCGELSREELQGYAKEYYAFEKEFPRFLSRIHSNCENDVARQMLLENLTHEEKGAENHPELWLRFAEGVGVKREEVKEHLHSDETEALLRVFRKTAAQDPVQGIAALYAYERQQPAVATQKIEGLKNFYGVTEGPAVQFFRAHEHYDVEHSKTEAELLQILCETNEHCIAAIEATEEVTTALNDFLTGVEKRYGAK